MIFDFFSTTVPASLKQVFGNTPENTYLAQQQARTTQAAKAQRARDLAAAQAAVAKGTIDPSFIDTSPRLAKFIINLSTATATANTKIVFGSKYAVENLYKRVDRSFTGNPTGIIQNQEMVDAAQFIFDTETYFFSSMILQAKPTDSTNTVNADNQLNSDFKVYNFGAMPGDVAYSTFYLAGTADPTAYDGLYRYVDLIQQGKDKINRNTLWEFEMLPKVNLSIVFTSTQRVKGVV